MATNITSTDTVQRVTMPIAAGNLEEITVPRGTRTVYIQSLDSLGTSGVAGKRAWTGVDGAAIGADYSTIPAGVVWVLPIAGEFVRGGTTTFYLASSVNSGIMEIETSSVIAGVAP